MTENLFDTDISEESKPLAVRVRPKTPEQMIGQRHLLGDDGPLTMFFQAKKFPSIIFWGPPGVGKTSFALLIAEYADYSFFHLSAVDAGVKEVRSIIANALNLQRKGKKVLLFIDEIHRFNKSQQDALLHAVEQGVITLIGATTENPSFEVNSALLSRMQVYRLKLLSDDDIIQIIKNAIISDIILSKLDIELKDWDFLTLVAGGDARTALNILELSIKLHPIDKKITLLQKDFEKILQQKIAKYDKKGESHYDTISAFIKSMRGSDPDAALFWLAKMLEAGEDPIFIARRMVVFASEDVGNADPFAITLAVSVFNAVQMIGMPECRINLAQGVTYLASCAKSNASYLGIEMALADIRNGVSSIVPMHLRNSPTEYMKKEGYGMGYRYPHDFDNHFVEENYFPENIASKTYYNPTDFGKEKNFKERLKFFWKNKKRN